jgi:hypothetical protein
MVAPEETSYSNKNSGEHLTKKCPECYAYLPLHAQVCAACGAKVGEVDKLGFAQRPIDWWGYLLALISIAGFVTFMWWAFFRE